ncbi:DUF1800 domain-containing protein [Muricauda sp. DJ-13]|uniref:DUF1800 domain-containing protein n=1 Tax=Croceivirga thetidis TaxID=2721623 RepID=A0ABX1GP90_9FLAO|nr:DUF1800 domain-containing protein [Croceivirga thetidis]NKI30861.1 DUF1800 domain-containing protein [Croceivirga thetidis]
MDMFVNCNTSSLATYAPPLDKIRVQHLYRRLGFSASNAEVEAAVGQTANALVDNLVDAALAAPEIPAPAWSTWTNANYPEDDDLARQLRNAQREEFRIAYGNALLSNNLRDRLSFFWSNHVVTQLSIYNCNAYLYEYINCLQRNALGNFRTLISEIGLTNAMLYYLDGAFNNGNNPNENYSRELYELFALGEGNGYTEEDIIETSRALSGYTNRGEIGCSPVGYNPERHDAGTKTILGQTGNWGYDDVINILFTQRPNEIGYFICKKLYEFFIHPDSQDETGNADVIINGLATTFVANNFELAPVLRQLFKSEHFFDETAIGVIIKSPFDLYLNFTKELGFGYDDGLVQNMIDASALIGQQLFEPVDVAGWQRDRSWINTNYIIGRWLTAEVFVDGFFQADQERFRTLAMDLVGPANSNTSNPEIVVRAIVDKFTPKGLLTEQDFENAMDAFKIDDVPENYYSPDYIDGGLSLWMLAVSMEAPIQVYTLLRYLTRQPEFQLK